MDVIDMMPQKCGKRVASTLRFSLVLIFLYTCALVCVIKSRYKKRANMRCPELLWAPSTSVWSRETTKRPPSPEGFFPVLPLLALLFFAMAAAPNGHTTVGCSLTVAVGCLLGCFLSERPNGVSRVVQNRLNGSKQSHMSKLRTVVRLHGDMGPHAAWYWWKSSSTQIVLGCAWLCHQTQKLPLSGNFQDNNFLEMPWLKESRKLPYCTHQTPLEIHSGSERAFALLIAEVLWISNISVPLFLAFALKNVQVPCALDILFWDRSLWAIPSGKLGTSSDNTVKDHN